MAERDLGLQYYHDQGIQSSENSNIPEWQIAGAALDRSLRMQKWHQGFELIMVDLDGVLINGVKPEPEPISDLMIPALLALQKQNVYIGTSTACNNSIEPYFAQQGLVFDGPRIQEGGQVLRIGNEVTYLTDASHRKYIEAAKKQLIKHALYVPAWKDVLASPKKAFTFAAGRWNGSSRMSIWMRTHQEEILEELMPILLEVAKDCDLDFAEKINMKPNRPNHGNEVPLTYVTFTQKTTEQDTKIDKSSPLRIYLPGVSVASIADGGAGDEEFAEELKKESRKYSRIWGIEETDEIDKEAVEKFLVQADNKLHSAEECALALQHCAAIRQGRTVY